MLKNATKPKVEPADDDVVDKAKDVVATVNALGGVGKERKEKRVGKTWIPTRP